MSSTPNSANEIDPCVSNLVTTALGTYEFTERVRGGRSGFNSNLLVAFNFPAGMAVVTGEGEEIVGLAELTYFKGLEEISKNFFSAVPLIIVIPAR